MISKKLTLSVLGRRNKQQIIKDILRPSPSTIISSPPVGGPGGLGCAKPPIGGTTSTNAGYFSADLSEVSGEWVLPVTPSYYTDVFFDGTKVFSGLHYTVDSSMNVVPVSGINPTSVQANYVIR